jgi:hypothetical protein
MAASNIFKNVTTTKLIRSDTGTTVNLSSVLSISITDNTQFLKDGSDNDSSASYVERQADQCRLQVDFRDLNQANSIARLKGDFYFTAVAVKGASVPMVVYNVAFAQMATTERWSEFQTYQMSAEGGYYGKVSDVS